METLLWGMDQVTLRAGLPDLTDLEAVTPVTWDGTAQIIILKNKILMIFEE